MTPLKKSAETKRGKRKFKDGSCCVVCFAYKKGCDVVDPKRGTCERCHTKHDPYDDLSVKMVRPQFHDQDVLFCITEAFKVEPNQWGLSPFPQHWPRYLLRYHSASGTDSSGSLPMTFQGPMYNKDEKMAEHFDKWVADNWAPKIEKITGASSKTALACLIMGYLQILIGAQVWTVDRSLDSQQMTAAVIAHFFLSRIDELLKRLMEPVRLVHCHNYNTLKDMPALRILFVFVTFLHQRIQKEDGKILGDDGLFTLVRERVCSIRNVLQQFASAVCDTKKDWAMPFVSLRALKERLQVRTDLIFDIDFHSDLGADYQSSDEIYPNEHGKLMADSGGNLAIGTSFDTELPEMTAQLYNQNPSMPLTLLSMETTRSDLVAPLTTNSETSPVSFHSFRGYEWLNPPSDYSHETNEPGEAVDSNHLYNFTDITKSSTTDSTYDENSAPAGTIEAMECKAHPYLWDPVPGMTNNMFDVGNGRETLPFNVSGTYDSNPQSRERSGGMSDGLDEDDSPSPLDLRDPKYTFP